MVTRLLLCLFFFSAGEDCFAQFQNNGRRGEVLALAYRQLNEEIHYEAKGRVPLSLSKEARYSLGIGVRYSEFKYPRIKERYGEDEFHSTDISLNRMKRSSSRMSLISLGVNLNGHQYFSSARNTFNFRWVISKKTEGFRKSYGVFLSSQGAIAGIPLPFFTYSSKTKYFRYNLGLPFLSFSNLNRSLGAEISPFGLRSFISYKFNENFKSLLSWDYRADNYILNRDDFKKNDDTLVIDRKRLSFNIEQRVKKRLFITYSLGYEYDKRFFRGQNLANKTDRPQKLEDNWFTRVRLSMAFGR